MTATTKAWHEHQRLMRRMDIDAMIAFEAANPPRCESAKAFREGVPLTECMEIARNVYRARTGQPVLDMADEAVFQRAKDGHRASMDIVMDRLRSRVLLAATGKPVFLAQEDAEDVTQEVLLKVSQRINRIPELRNLIPFALRVAHDLAINLRKKQAREAEVIVYDSDLAESVTEQGPRSIYGRPVSEGGYVTPARGGSDNHD